jgi:hypothetical protein
MILNDITELSIVVVLGRGIPNEESIALRVKERVNLGQYGIMLGLHTHSKLARPLQDSLFWFGDGMVNEGDWIFVNTGDGEPRASKSTDQLNSIFSVFWNKKATVFANSNVVPILFRVDAVDVLEPPANVPQITEQRRLAQN